MRQTDRQTDSQPASQPDRQTDRQADSQPARQTDRQTETPFIYESSRKHTKPGEFCFKSAYMHAMRGHNVYSSPFRDSEEMFSPFSGRAKTKTFCNLNINVPHVHVLYVVSGTLDFVRRAFE